MPLVRALRSSLRCQRRLADERYLRVDGLATMVRLFLDGALSLVRVMYLCASECMAGRSGQSPFSRI